MKLLVFVARVEFGGSTRTEPRALVATDAEGLRAVARRAVGLAALGFRRVNEEVVTLVKVDRLDLTLVTVLAFRAIVTGGARGVGTTRLLTVIAGEQRSVLVSEP